MASVVSRRSDCAKTEIMRKAYMKQFILIFLMVLMTGCATTHPKFQADSYTRDDMSVVLSTNFESAQSEAARALEPSYVKFGAPRRYVFGNMSSVYETDQTRLYGAGAIFARFLPSQPVFWQIEGDNLAASVDPIKTVHLIYDKADLTLTAFDRVGNEIRRGASFTVFERDLGARVIVSIYPTEKLSEKADLRTISFQQ